MKKLDQIIPSLHDSRKPDKELDSTRADRVWTALAEMFGNVFFNQFGDVPPSVWVAQINQLTDNQVRIGLTNIAADDLRFAPNLSQFIAACKRVDDAAVPYWGAPKQIEDMRSPGKMTYEEWKKKHGAHE